MPVRKIKAGYLNTTGGFQSLKLGRFVNAESALEYDFLFLLDLNPSVVWFEEQPLTTGYPDADTGRARSYTPDALARYKKDGGTEHHILYEVKHLADLRKDWKELKPKFKAAIREAKIRGWKFKIVTEKHIRTPQVSKPPVFISLHQIDFTFGIRAPQHNLRRLKRAWCDHDKRATSLPIP